MTLRSIDEAKLHKNLLRQKYVDDSIINSSLVRKVEGNSSVVAGFSCVGDGHKRNTDKDKYYRYSSSKAKNVAVKSSKVRLDDIEEHSRTKVSHSKCGFSQDANSLITGIYRFTKNEYGARQKMKVSFDMPQLSHSPFTTLVYKF